MTDTNNAPERLWADGNQDWDSGSWGQSKEFDNDVEYVRADLVVAQVIAFLNNQHILCTAGIGRDPEQYSSRFSVAANTLETAARRDKSWETK